MVSVKRLLVYLTVPTIFLLVVIGIVLILFYKGSQVSDTWPKLVIDHDGGADDAFAITIGILNEQHFGGPQLVALTTTYGNVNLNQAVINSDRILTLNNREDIPIYVGSEKTLISGIDSDYYYGYDGLGDDGYQPPGPIKVEKEHAALALIKLSKQYEGLLTVIALGPLTNLALAIRMDPDFINRLAHLYVGGGHIYSENHPKPEFNADMDPEGYYIVADSSNVNKVTFVPFSQIYTTMNISKEWRADVLGAIPTARMQALNGFERKSFAVSSAWTQLDPAVAAIALGNIVDEYRNSSNGIYLCGEYRGLNRNDFESTEPNVRLVYRANMDSYKQFLLDIFSAELNVSS